MNLDKITKLIPDFSLKDFNMFDTVTHVEWDKAMNYETGVEEETFSIAMQCDKGYGISIKCINANSAEIDLCGQIIGFCIDDMLEYGYSPDNRYHIRDYEDGRISLYCEDIIIESFTKLW